MELSSSRKETVRYQFESFCKKVLKHEARNHYEEQKRRARRERLFSELSPQETERLLVTDEYMTDLYVFNVLGYDVAVRDDRIGEALGTLPEQKRDIILLSYFLDLTDKEIGDRLNIVRSTVQYQRTSTLRQIKKYLEGEANEEK